MRILVFAIVVYFMSRPQINIALRMDGANEQAFVAIVKNTILLTISYLIFLGMLKVFRMVCRVLLTLFRFVARRPAPVAEDRRVEDERDRVPDPYADTSDVGLFEHDYNKDFGDDFDKDFMRDPATR